MRAREDLTNVQFPILNSHPIEAAACVRAVLIEAEAIRQCPLRMRIEHWELSIGQIPGRTSFQHSQNHVGHLCVREVNYFSSQK